MQIKMQQERIRHHLSRDDVAKMIGVSAEMVRLIETGQRKPSYDVLVKLENLFHKSHRQLFAVVDEYQEQDTKKETQIQRMEGKECHV